MNLIKPLLDIMITMLEVDFIKNNYLMFVCLKEKTAFVGIYSFKIRSQALVQIFFLSS